MNVERWTPPGWRVRAYSQRGWAASTFVWLALTVATLYLAINGWTPTYILASVALVITVACLVQLVRRRRTDRTAF